MREAVETARRVSFVFTRHVTIMPPRQSFTHAHPPSLVPSPSYLCHRRARGPARFCSWRNSQASMLSSSRPRPPARFSLALLRPCLLLVLLLLLQRHGDAHFYIVVQPVRARGFGAECTIGRSRKRERSRAPFHPPIHLPHSHSTPTHLPHHTNSTAASNASSSSNHKAPSSRSNTKTPRTPPRNSTSSPPSGPARASRAAAAK